MTAEQLEQQLEQLDSKIESLWAEREEQEQRRRQAVQAGNNHVYEVGYSHSWMEYTSIANSEHAAKERLVEIDSELRQAYEEQRRLLEQCNTLAGLV
jgi:outer membrane receptor for ferrienterochelin and colicin